MIRDRAIQVPVLIVPSEAGFIGAYIIARQGLARQQLRMPQRELRCAFAQIRRAAASGQQSPDASA